jgi:SAM-dependent methyltransferase
MKRQGRAFFAEIVAGIVAVVAALCGNLLWAAVWAVFAVGAAIAARVWSRTDPGPMPYFMRWLLFTPRGPHSPQHLKRILQPRPGERILEVGPGVGIHAIPVAFSLLPNGILDVLVVQQEMLDELKRRAAKAGVTNIVSAQGDAQKLPYPDRIFDAAYLIGVLGEVPDGAAALGELRRVLKPAGRLIIGEVFVDPDYISLPTLKEKARDVGFIFVEKAGPGIVYLAVFRAPVAAELESAGRAVLKWR